MEISVVIPLYNEEESIKELASWIVRVMDANSYSYEILFVDDGSRDKSWVILTEMAASNPNIKGIKFRRNHGKSAALQTGFDASQGEVVITMDADLQDSPDEIPALYEMITKDGYDLVSGWKKVRHDPLSKTIPTKLYNAVTRYISKVRLHDFNCGLKAYKKDVVKSVDVYGELHRYIPVMAKWSGFDKIGEKVVEHRAREFGQTKFGGWERFINGPLDLLSITFIGKFGKRPMHFLGTLGTFFFVAGFGILFYLSLAKILWDQANIDERPLFYFGILMLIIGTQLFVTGFLAELTVKQSRTKNSYGIADRLNTN